MRKVLDSIEDLLDSPMSMVSGFVTTILSLWGLFEIWQAVDRGIGRIPASVAVFLLLLVAIVPFIVKYFYLNIRRQFSLPARERFLFTGVDLRWVIGENGIATAESTKKYFFFREPEKEDLFDQAFSSQPFDLDQYSFHSQDANPVDREEIKKNHWKIFWEPRAGSIVIGEPYEHTFRSELPSHPKFTSKSFTVAAPVLTLRVSLEIESVRPVYRAYAYKKRWWQKLKKHDQIVRTAQCLKRMHAPPISTLDDRHFTWQVRNLKRGDIYYIVLLFKDEANERAAA